MTLCSTELNHHREVQPMGDVNHIIQYILVYICIIIYFRDITCYNPTRPPMMNADAIEDELRDLKVVLNKLLAEKETLVFQTQLPNVKFF